VLHVQYDEAGRSTIVVSVGNLMNEKSDEHALWKMGVDHKTGVVKYAEDLAYAGSSDYYGLSVDNGGKVVEQVGNTFDQRTVSFWKDYSKNMISKIRSKLKAQKE
jgi:hypothetical protein